MTLAAEKHESSTVALGALARDALAEFDGNTEKAISRLLYRLKKDPQLLKQVIEAAVRDAVYYRVQYNIRQTRSSIERSIDRQRAAQTIDRQRDKDRVVALAEAVSSCLLDMPIAGGKKLRDAGRGDLLAQIERYEKQAGTMSHRARWLRLILQNVPAGKRVGNVITEQRALELFEEAKDGKDKT